MSILEKRNKTNKEKSENKGEMNANLLMKKSKNKEEMNENKKRK